MALDLLVTAKSRKSTTGIAKLGGLTFRCGLGRGGLTSFKHEGDGSTPVGRWPILQMLYRPDRSGSPMRKNLIKPARAIRPNDGWCDAVGDRNYNRPVQHPYPASAETMWRADHLYDVVLILGHNHRPRIQRAGSAIFMHLAKYEPTGTIAPTAGCVSLSRRDLAVVLANIQPGSAVQIIG